jgi:hypothetical protein
MFETDASLSQPQTQDRLNLINNMTLLKEGTHVNDRYGNAVGGVISVMLDSTAKISGVVAKAGWLFTKETFLPVEWIDSFSTEGVSLKYAKGELSNLPQPQINSIQVEQGAVTDVDNRSPLAPATNRIADQLAGNSSGVYSGADTKDEGEPSQANPKNLAGSIITPANINASGTGVAGISPLVLPIVSEQDRER